MTPEFLQVVHAIGDLIVAVIVGVLWIEVRRLKQWRQTHGEVHRTEYEVHETFRKFK